jgi:hypothetical protein
VTAAIIAVFEGGANSAAGDVAKKSFASDRFSSGMSDMKDQLIIIPAGCHYSVSVIPYPTVLC